MENSLFYSGIQRDEYNGKLLDKLEAYSYDNSVQVYVLNSPLGAEISTSYDYNGAIVVLIPKHKICFLNLRENCKNNFDEYCEDFIEDLGYLSEKYDYKVKLGRPREWRNKLVMKFDKYEKNEELGFIYESILESPDEQRKADFLISLLIGSINDISRIGGDEPETLLDCVKKKIVLFDGDQSRFIYSQPQNQKRITIQGLAGTGKTELLLHKLKDLYINEKKSKIVFTCYNKILAASMRKRIPDFFNFMRVDEQIEWEERLWVMSSWGSGGSPNSGVYSYICEKYNLKYHPYSLTWEFDDVCKTAIKELKSIKDFENCFDYMLIDESQDFPQSFFDLCEMVTSRVVYVAGDIFQDIYDRRISQSVKSDYLLNKCYRTDPRTLMFAHAVGMGLYEKPVIRWLNDDEWISCGYQFARENTQFILSRTPLRRFEELDTYDTSSIEVLSCKDEEWVQQIIGIIDSIRKEHRTVKAGDIAIVFLGGKNNLNYALADRLAANISSRYSWMSVKGYETKDRIEDAIFISNRNNIKGLEFPFVIAVVTGQITQNVFARNAIYMILTRSFLKSYFIVDQINDKFIKIYEAASKKICAEGKMILREPDEGEKREQNNRVRIAVQEKRKPIKDLVDDAFAEFDTMDEISENEKKHIAEFVSNMNREENAMSDAELQEWIRNIISVACKQL